MRFASILLLAGATCCFAQTVAGPTNTECMAARIVTPSDTFTMPVAKTPEMLTMKGSVISTRPACAQPAPKAVGVKHIRIPSLPRLQPGRFQLLPNPFTQLGK